MAVRERKAESRKLKAEMKMGQGTGEKQKAEGSGLVVGYWLRVIGYEECGRYGGSNAGAGASCASSSSDPFVPSVPLGVAQAKKRRNQTQEGFAPLYFPSPRKRGEG